jgi:ATP-dependent protease Clp ATPase subunit
MLATKDWRVLLIGGGSGTGKTELSRALGRRFQVPVLEGDILRQVIESAVVQESIPISIHSRILPSGGFHQATSWRSRFGSLGAYAGSVK